MSNSSLTRIVHSTPRLVIVTPLVPRSFPLFVLSFSQWEKKKKIGEEGPPGTVSLGKCVRICGGRCNALCYEPPVRWQPTESISSITADSPLEHLQPVAASSQKVGGISCTLAGKTTVKTSALVFPPQNKLPTMMQCLHVLTERKTHLLFCPCLVGWLASVRRTSFSFVWSPWYCRSSSYCALYFL